MQFSVRSLLLTVLAGAIVGPAVAQQSPAPTGVPTTTAGTPKFQPEPFWPKPLPGNWILGQVAGLAVSPDNRIWIVHRPATLVDDEKGATKNPPETKCCTAAPPVLEFDTDGNLLRHWGGKGEGFEWPKNEHGLHVDKQGNVWVGGNDEIITS